MLVTYRVVDVVGLGGIISPGNGAALPSTHDGSRSSGSSKNSVRSDGFMWLSRRGGEHKRRSVLLKQGGVGRVLLSPPGDLQDEQRKDHISAVAAQANDYGKR